MNLIPYGDDRRIQIPSDWQHRGNVLAVPGSSAMGYTGQAVLLLTPDVLVLASPMGIEWQIPLWSIEDVSVIKLDGIIIERQTSVGPVLSPLPYPHGIEVVYGVETRIKMRVRIATMFANLTNEWVTAIRQAAYDSQTGDLGNAIESRKK